MSGLSIRNFATASTFGDEENLSDSGIRIKNETEDAEYSEEAEAMRDYNLPTSFNLDGTSTTTLKKGEKRTYYCDICLTELNSEDTMLSHKNGSKHLKKLNAFKQKNLDNGNPVDPNTYIRPAAPTKLAPKKIPIRLCEKLKETQQPIVGLCKVKEVISYSNVEMEPHYECDMCKNQGEANGMFNHVLGRGHREKFFLEKYDDLEPGNFDVVKYAERERENDHLDKINTIYSDELYPWPSGKAPWSLEQGGTGNPPTFGRDFRRIKSGGGLVIKPDPDRLGQVASEIVEGGEVVFHVKGLPPLHTAADLAIRYEAVKKIIEECQQFHERHAADNAARTSISTMNALLMANVEVLSSIKLQPDMYYSTPNPMEGLRQSTSAGRSPTRSLHRQESNYSYGARRSRSPSASTISRISPQRSPLYSRRSPTSSRQVSRSPRPNCRRRSPTPSYRSRSPSPNYRNRSPPSRNYYANDRRRRSRSRSPRKY